MENSINAGRMPGWFSFFGISSLDRAAASVESGFLRLQTALFATIIDFQTIF